MQKVQAEQNNENQAREHAKVDCARRKKEKIWGAMVRSGNVTPARTARDGGRARAVGTYSSLSLRIYV